ncbi:alpha-N-arabinofuranosidase [Streptomyces poonensis]|uniref:non-reducing end alpha-L-arabinofuranosidase n=1 Tax=Streptomyces poonensis TaxID=68255 RepID=A0A918PF71_9ACTN|nr:alpha-L-arabinofuranosidase C-terminal domain-containing protein [Streptomyces poonensis]GGZ04373.1 alpha-N-arabinofuranosidase [Streptomyces poonensis]GLJ89361.1 alpha-N-arabinofuranosidase [Streptomyces poonensis]
MPRAHIELGRQAVIAPVRRRTFGSFVEHLGRCVYTGLYEPGHPSANDDGFRMDVVELVGELGSTTIRYPGGDFVSGFRWEDSVGPREKRPVRRDLAWRSLESNQVGLDEFAGWLKLTGSEPMLAVNVATRGILPALDLLEYANHPSGTALSDLRIANGTPQPHDVRMWCLGNEMDGPWQTGFMTADDYGKPAARTAAAMKRADKDLELVVCGSSGSTTPTFGDWERTVLEHSYDHVDYVSCHAYYQEHDGDLGSFLASATDTDYFIDTVVASADHVGHKKRSNKKINVSFDEWNVWYLKGHQASEKMHDEWRHARDRVTSASLAQLVNVIAPIMTEPGGPAWRQTTFYPFSITSRLASGEVIRPLIEAPTYETARYGEASVVDAVATADEDRAAVFLVNRDLAQAAQVTIDVRSLGSSRITEAVTLADSDVYAKNTLARQDRVTPAANNGAALADGLLTIELPPTSWTAVALR